jgi:hypothetical protein
MCLDQMLCRANLLVGQAVIVRQRYDWLMPELGFAVRTLSHEVSLADTNRLERTLTCGFFR